jgi:hypothetical protein
MIFIKKAQVVNGSACHCPFVLAIKCDVVQQEKDKMRTKV